eukprot:Skav235070  [mRNA]  locus=scaffold3466:53246:66593:- [translate_table: standard]
MAIPIAIPRPLKGPPRVPPQGPQPSVPGRAPGFTCYELDHFYRVFQRFDRDSSDTMSCTEFANALTWLGFPYGPDKLQEFHRQNDVDGDGQLGEGEFISCLRRVLDEEMKQVESFLSRVTRGSSMVAGDRLKVFIHGLGYSSSPQAILDALSSRAPSEEPAPGAQALQDMKLQLTVDDVCKVLSRALRERPSVWEQGACALRACDGFTQRELRELKMPGPSLGDPPGGPAPPFAVEDQVQAPAINRALRWLGHRLSLQQTLRLIAEAPGQTAVGRALRFTLVGRPPQEVDADGGGSLDFTMFVKEKDQARSVEGVLDCDQQNEALTLLNCVDAQGRLPQRSTSALAHAMGTALGDEGWGVLDVGEMDGADLRVFLGIVERFKKSYRQLSIPEKPLMIGLPMATGEGSDLGAVLELDRWVGRGNEIKRYGMFREDVADLAAVSVSKLKVYVPVLTMSLGYAPWQRAEPRMDEAKFHG